MMKQGKQICERLKTIRSEIAQSNEIDYTPVECDHQGDCDGTCPACEKETRWLERQLRLRQSLGKVVTIAGLGMALASMPACGLPGTQVNGYLEENDSIEVEMGEVPEHVGEQEPAEVNGKTMLEDPNPNRHEQPGTH